MIPVSDMITAKSASELYSESKVNAIESQLNAIIYNCNMQSNSGEHKMLWSGVEIYEENINTLESKGYKIKQLFDSVMPQYIISWFVK